MDFANPLSPAALQTPAAQQLASAAKSQQLQRAQIKKRVTASRADEADTFVETSEEIFSVRRDSAEDGKEDQSPRHRYSAGGKAIEDDDGSQLDLTG